MRNSLILVFVGDKPSSKNLDPKVPFVGTPSHKVLLKWIDKLAVKNYILLNSHSDEDKIKLKEACSQKAYKCMALGNNASKVLENLKIEHLKLPHPSPRNRLLNNKSFIDSELEKCNNYINKGV